MINVLSALIQIQLNTPFYSVKSQRNSFPKRNKQILFNTFDDSLPMQMPISTQRKLRLLVLLQKKYLYTCKNIVTKPNLEEFLRKLFEQYRIENCGKQY